MGWAPILFLVTLSASASACGARTGLDADLGPEEDAGGLPAGTTRLGSVTVTTTEEDAFATAQFLPPAGEESATCVNLAAAGAALRQAVVGGCGLFQVPPCPGQSSLDAGPIVFSALGSMATLSYSGTSPIGGYVNSLLPGPVAVGPGVTVGFSGQGSADVPAWTASVTLPALSQLTSPADTVCPLPTIDTSVELAVTWTPIPSGEASFSIGTGGYALECYFDASAGSAVVPQADLVAIKTHLANLPAIVTFQVSSRSQVVVGQWAIEALAYNGGPAGFPVSLE